MEEGVSVLRTKLFSPSRTLLGGFVVIILLGTGLLMLPAASASGQPLSFLDALFMATSAACVTGLAVVDVGGDLSRFGQTIVLLLIQIGGLGFMTFAVLIFLMLGKKISFQQRLYIQESLQQPTVEGVVRLAIWVFVIAFAFQAAGTAVLFVRWYPEYGGEALFLALFHAVAAFNNAGLSLWPDSLMRYGADPVINGTVSALVFLGSLGFTVLMDIGQHHRWSRFSLHTKVVLVTTFVLLGIGATLLFLIELCNPSSQTMTWPERLWGAFFQSVSRTSGFYTWDIGTLLPTSQLLLMVLMFIGASPGSTGSGIKTTTVALLVLTVIGVIRGRRDVAVFQRRISQEQIMRAVVLFLLGISMVMAVALALSFTEREQVTDFLPVLFEATSAFSNNGLSMGLTPHLSPTGKLLLTVTMMAGRVGPLTVAFALTQRQRKETYRYPEEKVLIG